MALLNRSNLASSLDHPSTVLVREKAKWTPLLVAALRGHDDAVKVLLENGADVGLTDITNSSALHVAAGYGRLKIVRMLLEAKVDVNGRDAGGSTPLHVAAQQGQSEVSG